MVTRSINIYGEVYRRSCKEKGVDRLLDQAGPRKVRPVSVEVVVGPNPTKKAALNPPIFEKMPFAPAPKVNGGGN